MIPNDAHASLDAHRRAQDVLPWLANGRLAGAELTQVQAHLHACPTCRTDLALLHTVRAAGTGPDVALDVDAAFARLLPQLDTPAPVRVAEPMPHGSAPVPVPGGWRARLAANDGRWLRAAVAAQCCVIAVLGALLGPSLLRTDAPSATAGDYRVLGAANGAGAGVQGSLIVTFHPDTPERELRRIVAASGARIVGGPTATGAWLLGADGDGAAVAARLRREAAVTLAEPLGAESRP